MKSLSTHISEKLVINKNYNNSDSFINDIIKFFEIDDDGEAKIAVTKYINDNKLDYKMNNNIDFVKFYIYSYRGTSDELDEKSKKFGHVVEFGNFDDREYNKPNQIYVKKVDGKTSTLETLTNNNQNKYIIYLWKTFGDDLWCLFDINKVK